MGADVNIPDEQGVSCSENLTEIMLTSKRRIIPCRLSYGVSASGLVDTISIIIAGISIR